MVPTNRNLRLELRAILGGLSGWVFSESMLAWVMANFCESHGYLVLRDLFYFVLFVSAIAICLIKLHPVTGRARILLAVWGFCAIVIGILMFPQVGTPMPRLLDTRMRFVPPIVFTLFALYSWYWAFKPSRTSAVAPAVHSGAAPAPVTTQPTQRAPTTTPVVAPIERPPSTISVSIIAERPVFPAISQPGATGVNACELCYVVSEPRYPKAYYVSGFFVCKLTNKGTSPLEIVEYAVEGSLGGFQDMGSLSLTEGTIYRPIRDEAEFQKYRHFAPRFFPGLQLQIDASGSSFDNAIYGKIIMPAETVSGLICLGQLVYFPPISLRMRIRNSHDETKTEAILLPQRLSSEADYDIPGARDKVISIGAVPGIKLIFLPNKA